MKFQGSDYRSVWMEDNRLFIIDQNKLPFKFEVIELKDINSVYDAIVSMQIRGAPAIGAVAALAYAISICETSTDITQTLLDKNYEYLLGSRPTAIDLRNGLDRIRSAVLTESDQTKWGRCALTAAEKFVEKSVLDCQAIGNYGNQLISNGCRILTHCNAGALATVDHGTALAPLRVAHTENKNIFVYVDETRPRWQGARLTAWELWQEGIKHAVIVDGAAGHFMQKNRIDLVITGADRIAANGDIANKIGTYSVSVLAKENNVPFYIAAPYSTFDLSLKSGEDIPIEERSAEEVLEFNGHKLTSGNSAAFNPAFDITPAQYITGYITPAGIFKRNEFNKLWEIVTKERSSGQY